MNYLVPLFREIGIAFLGLIVGVVFQDFFATKWQQVKKIIYKIIRYTQKHSALPQTHEFMLGNRKTSIVVIDGDGYQEFNSKNIRVQISESISPAWPQEVEKYYEETLSEIRQKKEKGENVPWNGSVLSLRSYRINRTPNLEEYTIDLFLEVLDYYRVYSTIKKLGSGLGSLKQKYIDSFEFDNDSIYKLPNAIGICMLIKTADDKAVFAVRSNSSGFRPGENDVSIVEGVNPLLDINGHSIMFDKIAKRAVQEEICDVDESNINASILGMVFDKEYNQWNIIGCINLKLTQDEIIKRRNRGVSGKWELRTLDFQKFSPKDLMRYLSTHKMWDMGMVAIYFSLIYNHFTVETIEKYARKYLKKYEKFDIIPKGIKQIMPILKTGSWYGIF